MNKTLAAVIAVFFFLFFSYWFEFTIIIWSVAGLIVLFGMVGIYFYCMLKRTELKAANYDAKAKRYVARQDGFGMLHVQDLKTGGIENYSAYPGSFHNGTYTEPEPGEVAGWQTLINALAKKEVSQPLTKMLPEPQQQIPNLFNILSKAERVLVKGPTKSGKTTLFRNIAQQSSSMVIVVDPHFKPGLWPEHCKIVGKGRDHQEISKFLDWLSEELDRRYKLRAVGDESYKSLTIIIDEWMSISNKCKNATKIITEMITESRKSKMKLFIGSHSDQVEALGIRGQGKLREGLLIIRLYYDQVNGNRRSTFDFGQGENDCFLYETVASNLIIEDKDSRFVRLVQEGMSRQQAAQEVYSRDYAGDVARKGKKLLRKI
jgi:hypothetical protein